MERAITRRDLSPADPAPQMTGQAGQFYLSGQAGVTLIELVVVVAVMASLAAGVSLMVGRGAGPEDGDLSRFVRTYEQNRNLAVLERQMRGLFLEPAGSRQALKQDGSWGDPGRLQRWSGRVSHLIEGTRPDPNVPDILFLPSGQTSAFVITFGARQCRSDGWTGLRCDAG